jgi:hypothetical protein
MTTSDRRRIEIAMGHGKRCAANWTLLVAALALGRINHRPTNGTPDPSSEQIRQRDDEILAYPNQHPKATNGEIGVRYGMSGQAISAILYRGRRMARRNQRLIAKARKWGLIHPPA